MYKNYFFDFIDFKFNKSKWTFFRLSTFVFSSEGGLGLRYSFLGFTTHTQNYPVLYVTTAGRMPVTSRHVSFLKKFFLRGDLNTLLLFMKASMGKLENRNSRLITILVISAPHVEATHVRLPKYPMIPTRHVEASRVQLPKQNTGAIN